LFEVAYFSYSDTFQPNLGLINGIITPAQNCMEKIVRSADIRRKVARFYFLCSPCRCFLCRFATQDTVPVSTSIRECRHLQSTQEYSTKGPLLHQRVTVALQSLENTSGHL